MQQLLGASVIPVLCLPGNHDDPGALQSAFGNSPFQTLGHVVLGNWLLIGLDSTEPGRDSGRLSSSELRRLDETLARFPDRPTVVALHHPPVMLGSRWIDALGLLEAEQFWAVIDRHPNVRCVVFGHAHQTYDSTRGHVRILGAPATSAQFLPGSDDFAMDERPPGWRVINLDPSGQLRTAVNWLSLP